MSLRIGLLLPILLALVPSLFEVHGGEPAPNTPDHRVIEALELWKGGNPSARHRGLRRLERLGPRAAAAVPSLIPSLTDPDPTIRRETAEILEEIGEPAQAAVPALLAALGDSERDVRKMAARALGSIKPDPKVAIPALVASIRAGRDRRCLEAISTLGTLGEPAVPALIDFLGDNEPGVSRLAARALAAIGPGARAAIPALIEAQRRLDHEERQRVAEALARMGPATVQPLVLALRDRDPKVRGGAARALELLGPGAKAAVPALIAALADPEPPDDPESPRGPAFSGQTREGEPQPSGYFAALRAIGAAAVPPLLERIDRPDERDRALAFRALGFLGCRGKAAIPRLLALLNDPNRRLEAARALGGIGPAARAAVPTLIAGLKDPDPVYRACSAETLGWIGWSLQNGQYTRWTVARQAIAPLIAALKDLDPSARAAAAIALRDIGPEATRAIPDAISLLHDPAAEVRAAALGTFPRLGEVPAAERQTIGRLLRDADPRVRLAAAKLITNDDLSRETVIAGLLAALEDPDTVLRAEAALKLAGTGKHTDISLDDRTGGRAGGNNATLVKSPGAGASLRAALADPDSRIRAGVAYALASFQNEAAATVPLLIPRLRDPSVSVRIAAAVALGQFGKDARAAVPALMEAATDPDGIRSYGLGVWAAAAQALGAISPEASSQRLDHLFALLDNPNADVRRRAARVLQHYDIEVCAQLFHSLADPKTPRRVRVELMRVIMGDSWGWGVEHLEELRDLSPHEARDAIPALRDLTGDRDPEVRENARNVLNTLEGEGDDEAPDRSFLEAVREGDIACWEFDSEEDGAETSELGTLLEGLKDPDEDVRTAAAYRLSALADPLPEADDLPEGETRDAAEEQAHAEGLTRIIHEFFR
ncbi:MAG: HEAT repeat domain-containing protein [Isosphaeraceae bacterium]